VHPNVDKVVEAGRLLGVTVEPVEFAESTRTAGEAAAAIGIAVGQIVKSMVFTVDGEVLVALMSGSNRVDERRLGAAAGGARAKRADADAVRAATGFPIGGVPPFGHRNPLRVFVDRDLLAFDEVWAACGTPHVNFAAHPADLVQATSGVVSDLAPVKD
jgi:prolyl-tRNA editing enzyme YbaK/EbsC (Cys-tRNA(Pro) deacylase)